MRVEGAGCRVQGVGCTVLWEIERDENPTTRSGPNTPAAETMAADAEFTWDRV